MKKILSLVLAFMMLFSVVLTASAEVSLSKYVFKGLGLDPNDDTVYTYTFGKFTGDPDEVGVKVNKDYKLSDEALTKAKANGGVFGIGLADTNNVLEGLTYSVIPYAITAGEREEGKARTVGKKMGELLTDADIADIKCNIIGSSGTKSYARTLRDDVLQLPQWDLDENGNPVATTFGSDMFTNDVTALSTGSYGQYNFLYSCPDEMIGSQIFSISRDAGLWYSDSYHNYSWEFTLKKSAIVYVVSHQISDADLFDRITISNKWQQAESDAKKSEFNPSNGFDIRVRKMYCPVPEGETLRFTTPVYGIGAGSYTGPYSYIKSVDYDEIKEITGKDVLAGTPAVHPDDIELEVKDIQLISSTDSLNVFETSLLPSPLKLPEFDKDKDGNPIPTLFGSSVFNKATRAFADMYHFYVRIPEEMVGAKVVSTRRDTFGDYKDYKVKFTLNKSATLYFNTEGKVPSNAVKLSEKISYRQKNSYSEAVAHTYDPADSGDVAREIWKIECNVPTGETKTFEFDLRSYSWTGPMLFIKD